MEIQTIQRYIHSSPRKLRLVADMVRKMEPAKALDILRITQKYAARDLVKALETVLANAKLAGLDLEKIGFKKIEIDESVVLRRFHAGTRGRVKPFKRKMSHIKIVLTDELENQTVKESKVKNQKLEVKKEQEISKTINGTGKPGSETKSKKGDRTELSK